MICCVWIWSGSFGPDCKEKGLKTERHLFDMIVMVVRDQEDQDYIIEGR
jgi:hypothetical protein